MARSKLRVGSRLGKYKLRRRIARGGFGEVFAAHDDVEAVQVALKIPTIEEPDDLEDALREVRLTAKLEHPNVLGIKSAEFIDEQLVIALPLGMGTLEDRLAKRMALPRALDFAEQLLEALAYAHDSKIIHRDLKPDNLILFPGNLLKLADFGSARPSSRRLGETATGTLGYMAPEQALGRATMRSDVFSAGLILYRMTARALPRWPFQWPGPGRDRLKELGPSWSEFLRRALEVTERKRYRDGREMLDAFGPARDATLVRIERAKRRRRR
jgi:serine/threonine-protein kinase